MLYRLSGNDHTSGALFHNLETRNYDGTNIAPTPFDRLDAWQAS